MPGINISTGLGFFTDKPSVTDTANASIDKPMAIKMISNRLIQIAFLWVPINATPSRSGASGERILPADLVSAPTSPPLSRQSRNVRFLGKTGKIEMSAFGLESGAGASRRLGERTPDALGKPLCGLPSICTRPPTQDRLCRGGVGACAARAWLSTDRLQSTIVAASLSRPYRYRLADIRRQALAQNRYGTLEHGPGSPT